MASSDTGTAALNIARINGPFKEHSLGNLLNARSKAETRLANRRLSATHNANRTLISAINRHIGFRKNMAQRVEADMVEQRRARLASQRAFEAAEAVARPPPPARPPLRIPSSGIGPYYTSQFIETGTEPIKRRTRRARRTSRRLRQ
jgi:hypothetical protein